MVDEVRLSLSLLKRRNRSDRELGKMRTDNSDASTENSVPRELSTHSSGKKLVDEAPPIVTPTAKSSDARVIGMKSEKLSTCSNCGRQFNDVSLQKHEKICAKVFSKKRKVFDSAKQRSKSTSNLSTIV
jgi:protein-arginine kinase activator protein McsA